VYFLSEGDKPERPYWIAFIDGEPIAPQLSEELAKRLAEGKFDGPDSTIAQALDIFERVARALRAARTLAGRSRKKSCRSKAREFTARRASFLHKLPTS
jgi:hypothetical protein